MEVAVEPLPELAGPSNEGVAFIHDYALNEWKTCERRLRHGVLVRIWAGEAEVVPRKG